MTKKNKKRTIDPKAFSHDDVKKALIKHYFDDKKPSPEQKPALNFLFQIALFNLSELRNEVL